MSRSRQGQDKLSRGGAIAAQEREGGDQEGEGCEQEEGSIEEGVCPIWKEIP